MHQELHYTTETISAFLLAFIPGIINFGLVAYVLFKMPSRPLINIFILILITSGCWQFANAFMRISADAYTARFWDSFFSPIGLFATPLLLHFALVYTDKIKIRSFRYAMYFMYMVFFIVTGMYQYVYTYDSYKYHNYWGWVNIRADTVYTLITGSLVVLFMLANVLFLLAELPRTQKGSNKYKGLILISGSLLIIVLQVAITELIFPVVLEIPPAPLTPTTMLAYSAGTYIALTVYHFFRGDESINKTDLINSVSDIIIVVNNSLEIIYVNKTGLEQINTTMANLEGKQIDELLTCEELDATTLKNKLWDYAFSQDSFDNLRCSLQTYCATSIPVLVKANIIQGSTNPGGLLLLCRNISDVEIAQEEARRLHLDISNQKKFEKEILKKNEELTKINRELDQFVYSVSHDIRSPLMSILGLINIANDEVEDPLAVNYLDMIKNRVIKLDEFTLEIIHFARNSRTELKAEKVNIKALINNVVENLRYQEKAQDIVFDFEIDFDEEFQTDKGRLEVVLSNLVSNSIKYQRSETGAPFIKITARKLTGNVLEISVADNGEGIEEDKQESIFDMFSRSSTRSEGSGLGLYIVKEIVEKFGGAIHVKSEKNVGSEFTLTIPEILEQEL